ncbi:MAG: LPS export ABC transporter periplasmic protein LptC [Bacteroidales bacterium]|jgi:LPS export ABC transporter protein LptC|nr:LPS export ABC transporter periplasmic protein LptC [Bacteroidales bacterium]
MIFSKFRIGLYGLGLALLVISCQQSNNTLVLDENAPEQSMKNATIQYTDSGRVQMVMWGEEILNYDDEEQTQEFPKHVKATFYDKKGKITSVITADEATNLQKKKLMHLRKNVIIKDLQEGKTTYTEEFYWDQDKGLLYSDVPLLQIFKDGTKQRGSGFRSNENMSDFQVIRPRFEVNLN